MNGRTVLERCLLLSLLRIGWQLSLARKPEVCLRSSEFKVGGGYWLRLPVFGWYTSKGRSLEGNGLIRMCQSKSHPMSWQLNRTTKLHGRLRS